MRFYHHPRDIQQKTNSSQTHFFSFCQETIFFFDCSTLFKLIVVSHFVSLSHSKNFSDKSTVLDTQGEKKNMYTQLLCVHNENASLVDVKEGAFMLLILLPHTRRNAHKNFSLSTFFFLLLYFFFTFSMS